MSNFNVSDRWSRALRHQERVEQVAQSALTAARGWWNASQNDRGTATAAAAVLCWAEAHAAHWQGPHRQAPTARPSWWTAADLPDRRQRSSGAAWTAASLAAYWRLREECLADLTKLAEAHHQPLGQEWQEVAHSLARGATGRGGLTVMDRINVAAALTNELYKFVLHQPQEASAYEMAAWMTVPLPLWEGDSGYTQRLQEHLRTILGFWEQALAACIPPVFGARYREPMGFYGDGNDAERYMCREHIEFAAGPGWRPLRDGWDNPGPYDEWRCCMCSLLVQPVIRGNQLLQRPADVEQSVLQPDDIPF